MSSFSRRLAGVFLLLGLSPSSLISQSPAPKVAAPASQDAVLLEESLEIEIRSETEAIVRQVNRTQVLTEAGAEEFGTAAIFYSVPGEFRQISGATILPSGKRLDLKKPMISDEAAFESFELYSDSRRKVLHFPSVVPGSTVEYRYEQVLRNLFFLPRFFAFQESIPARLKSLSVSYPSSFPLTSAAQNGAPEARREESQGSVHLDWQARDLPPLAAETGMPPYRDIVPAVSLFPGRIVWGRSVIDATSWDGIAKWYWDLARERMSPAPEVRQAALGLAPQGSDPATALSQLFEFSQRKINYVAISLGIGGYQPHANGDVFKHLYGDCKDKATLLIAMLQSSGLKGYPVLIRTRDNGKMRADQPELSFNHAIVAIPREGGYLFLDPTSEETPLGQLPSSDQGALVLVIKDGGAGEVLETPIAAPEENRRQRKVEAKLDLAGNLEGTYTIDFWGSDRNYFNYLEWSSGSGDRPNLVQAVMEWLCPGAVVKSHQLLPPKKPGDPYRIRVDFQVPRLSTRAGSLELLNPHVARSPLPSGIGSGSQRRYPFFFDELYADAAEVRIALPTGKTVKQVPARKTVEGPGLSASFEYDLETTGPDHVLVLKRSLRVGQREIPAAEYPSVKKFVETLGREESTAVTLIPAS
jgi:transglutaminase-like putative cysteine protease